MLAIKNPWTLEQREIIAAIVSDALTIKLEASDVVGCVVEGDEVHVIWNGEFRQSFWFGREWFRDRVAAKKQERELAAACDAVGLELMPYSEGDNGWHVCRNDRYAGQIIPPGNGVDYWVVVPSYGSRGKGGKTALSAINALMWLTVAVSV
jgi:hypothetical protein